MSNTKLFYLLLSMDCRNNWF